MGFGSNLYSLQITFGIFWILVRVFAGAAMAWYATAYGRKQKRLAFGIPAVIWGLLVFIEPAWGILCFWVLHCSKLRPDAPDKEKQRRADDPPGYVRINR